MSSGPSVNFSFLTAKSTNPIDLMSAFQISGMSTSGASPFTYKGKSYTTGTNLLCGTFQNAAIGGAVGSQFGVFLDDNNAQGAVTFK